MALPSVRTSVRVLGSAMVETALRRQLWSAARRLRRYSGQGQTVHPRCAAARGQRDAGDRWAHLDVG
jgi:hypothetical protein